MISVVGVVYVISAVILSSMYCVVALVNVGNEIDVFSEVGVLNVVSVVSS